MAVDALGQRLSLQHESSAQAVANFGLGFLGYEPRVLDVLAAAEHDESTMVQACAAALWMFSESPAGPPKAREHLARAARSGLPCTEREQQFAAAISHWVKGDVRSALTEHEALAHSHPRDLVSIKLGQYHAFNRGDSPTMLRLALLAWTRHLHQRQLAALRFDQPEAMALWRRLSGSLFDVQGGEAELAPLQAGAAPSAAAPGPCVLLVSDDLPLEPDSAAPLLLRRFGWAVAAAHRLPLDDRQAAAGTLAALRDARPRPIAVALIAPAERDPIVAVALCLRAVCDAAGPGVETRLLLQGADTTRLQLWQRFAQIQRLPMGIEAWSP